MEAILDLLANFRDVLASAVVILLEIVKYVGFGAMIILVLTSVITDRQGTNIGFSATRWAIIAGVVAGCIQVAQTIFGI